MRRDSRALGSAEKKMPACLARAGAFALVVAQRRRGAELRRTPGQAPSVAIPLRRASPAGERGPYYIG